MSLKGGGKVAELGELEKKIALREERDRLLEIKRVTPPEAAEAHRLIDQRLTTIQECLEG